MAYLGIAPRYGKTRRVIADFEIRCLIALGCLLSTSAACELAGFFGQMRLKWSMRSVGCRGFAKISKLCPLSSAVLRSSAVAGCPENRTILQLGTISPTRIAVSIPVIPPKNTSAINTSGFHRVASSTACSPLWTAFASNPLRFKIKASVSEIADSSSTMRTRGLGLKCTLPLSALMRVQWIKRTRPFSVFDRKMGCRLIACGCLRQISLRPEQG